MIAITAEQSSQVRSAATADADIDLENSVWSQSVVFSGNALEIGCIEPTT